MVIYEVNLTIEKEIYLLFQSWLSDHITTILQFPGFIQACILKPEEEKYSARENLIVQYKLESREALEHYLTHFAPKMREEGISLFQEKFSAQRRILQLQNMFLTKSLQSD